MTEQMFRDLHVFAWSTLALMCAALGAWRGVYRRDTEGMERAMTLAVVLWLAVGLLIERSPQ